MLIRSFVATLYLVYMRLTMKPSQTPANTGSLPSALTKAKLRTNVASTRHTYTIGTILLTISTCSRTSCGRYIVVVLMSECPSNC